MITNQVERVVSLGRALAALTGHPSAGIPAEPVDLANVVRVDFRRHHGAVQLAPTGTTGAVLAFRGRQR